MPTRAKEFPALVVAARGPDTATVREITEADLPAGEVLIEVAWSSLNYKDALAVQGYPGVAGRLPHVPGIDCAGVVLESADNRWQIGQQVLVTGYDLGSGAWGGHAGRVRVPGDWVVALPDGLTLRDAMIYGTAGFTAAQAVAALERAGVAPPDGQVLVTGATGGVGLFSVAILARLGYEVVAMTGKPEHRATLCGLGAAEIVDRELFASNDGDDDRPLLPARWAGAVDTVGGATLTAIIRSLRHRGCVAACGLVGGHALASESGAPLTVYPFLLRGVTLDGIDSAKCPRSDRLAIWQRLATDWRVALPEALVSEKTLDEVADYAQQMLAGRTFGRTLVQPIPGSQTIDQ